MRTHLKDAIHKTGGKSRIDKSKTIHEPAEKIGRIHVVKGAIYDKWIALGGSKSILGPPETDELTTPDGIGRYNHFKGGSIYWTPATGAQEVHGAIRDKWASLGWEQSGLGYPTADEADFDGGRVSVFQNGSIYWWPDTGAIELNDVVLHYTGLICFEETDWDQLSNSDEPYVLLGVVAPNGPSAHRSAVYDDVDAGESRPDLMEIYRGKPYGLSLSVVLMEHDHGDPDKYKGAMQAAVGKAMEGITKAIGLIPSVGPALAAVAGPLLQAVAPTIGEELNRLLDTDDDKIGEVTIPVTAREMVVLAARTPNSTEKDIGYKLVTPLLTGEGAAYKVYFGLVPA